MTNTQGGKKKGRKRLGKRRLLIRPKEEVKEILFPEKFVTHSMASETDPLLIQDT